MKRVFIYCFGDPHFKNDLFEAMLNEGICGRDDYELWTLNNWFERIETEGDINPDRVYQIHTAIPDGHDYVSERALEALSTVPEVTVCSDLGLDNQTFFESPLRFEEDWFANTLSYMLSDCVWEEVDEVWIYRATMLFGCERRCELWGMLKNIEYLREKGIRVVAPWEPLWRGLLEQEPPEWINLDYGSLIGQWQRNLETGETRWLTRDEYLDFVKKD